MPLVVPGLQSKDGKSSGDDWMSKLMGKKLGDTHDEIVRLSLPSSSFPFLLHHHSFSVPHPVARISKT
tara:strand:- start:5832 stop:6035 length:204 start_codon:yes stop_codon:yes gene_type:complete